MTTLIQRTASRSQQDFEHRHAAHCESGVMSSLLRHHGLDISEAMAFGLASAPLFVHLPFVRVEGFPLTAYRAAPGAIIRGLQKTLGVRMRSERFRDPQAAGRRLDTLLDQGQVVGAQASVYWLPYFPPDMRFHFNAHNLLIYGRTGDDYLISDPVAEHTVRCAREHLDKARFARGIFAPRGLLYYPQAMPRQVHLENAVRQALRKTCFLMLRTPWSLIGVGAIRRLAESVRRLADPAQDPRYARLFVSFIVRMQEEIGTGGGGFRFVYASFLQEAGQLLGRSELESAAVAMTAAGDAWRQFALAGARFCQQKAGVGLDQLATAMLECYQREHAVFRQLAAIKT